MYMNHMIVYIYKFKTTDQHCGKQQSAPALGTGQEKNHVLSKEAETESFSGLKMEG